jgi:transposase
MLAPGSEVKIYLCTGHTDMRKGIHTLSMLASSLVNGQSLNRGVFVFRGRRADRLKVLWWDGQGFCLFYKCFDSGKFIWPTAEDKVKLGISRAQLSMLIEGIDWRNPQWTKAPLYTG